MKALDSLAPVFAYIEYSVAVATLCVIAILYYELGHKLPILNRLKGSLRMPALALTSVEYLAIVIAATPAAAIMVWGYGGIIVSGIRLLRRKSPQTVAHSAEVIRMETHSTPTKQEAPAALAA